MEIEYSEWVQQLRAGKTPLEKAMERAGVYIENGSIANKFLWQWTTKEEQKLLENECNRLWLEIINIDPRGNSVWKAFIKSLKEDEPKDSDDTAPAEPVTEVDAKPTRGRKAKK